MKKIKKHQIWLLWIIGCVLIISRRPDMFFNAQPWAEDATVFIRGVLDDGWLSLFKPYAGYLNVVSRIIALFAVHISSIFQQGLVWAPTIMNISAILISSYCAVIICSSRFDWLGKKYLRLLLSLLIILFHGAPEVYGNVTNIHWWLGILAFFILWDLFITKKMPNWRDVCIFCVIILSSPNGLLIFPALCLLYWNINRFKLRKELLKIIPVFLFSVIVGGMILLSRDSTGSSANANLFAGIQGYVLTGVFADLIVADAPTFVKTHSFSILQLIGFFLLAVMLLFAWKSIKKLYFPLIFLLLIIILTVLGTYSFYIPLFIDNYTANGQRYIFIPAVIVMSILIYQMNAQIVQKSSKKHFKVALLGIIFLLMLSGISKSFKFSPFVDYHWKKRALIYDAKGSVDFCIPINPTGWQLPLPSTCGQECMEQFLSQLPVSKVSLDNRYIAYADTAIVKWDNVSILRITDYSVVVYQLPESGSLQYCILNFEQPPINGRLQLMFLSEKNELLASPYLINTKEGRAHYVMEIAPPVPYVRFLRIDFTQFLKTTPAILNQLDIYTTNK